MSEPYLVVADVDRVQDYVFATTRLRTIRGASAVVEVLGEKIENELTQPGEWAGACRCLRHQGGQIVIIYEGNQVDLLEKRLEFWARELSDGALTLTTGRANYEGASRFKTNLGQAFTQVKTRKEQISALEGRGEPPLLGGYVRHCSLCQLYPATPGPDQVDWRPGDDEREPRFLCAPCWTRLEHARKIAFDQRLLTAMRSASLDSSNPWTADYQPAMPKEIDDIWKSEDEGRYLALISADGDGIGRLLEGIDDPTLYHEFSDAFDVLAVQTIAVAACNVNLDWGRPDTIPLLPIISGGDDFTFLLPAEYALNFAQALAKAFIELSSQDPTVQQVLKGQGRSSSHLTLSMGVAITKPHFPFSALRRLAGELRGNAKQLRKEHHMGMIDFALISTSGAGSLSQLRAQYERTEAGKIYYLTRRPYSADELRRLLDLKDQLFKEFARSNRKYLYQECWQSRSAAEAAFKRTRGQPDEKDTLGKILRALGCLDGGIFDADQRTPVVDALEIADL